MNDIVEEIKLFKAQQQEKDDTVETESCDITDLIDGGFGNHYEMEYFDNIDSELSDIYYESDNGTSDTVKQGRIKTLINKIKAFIQRLIQRYRMWRGKKYIEKIEKSLKDPKIREKLSKKKISGKYILDDTTVNYIKEAHDLLDGLYDNHQNIDAYANKLDDFSERFFKYYENTWKVTKKTDTVLHQYELAKEVTPLLNHMMIAMGQKFCGEYLEPTKDNKDDVINKFGEYAGEKILIFINRLFMITSIFHYDVRYAVTYYNSQNPDWVDDNSGNVDDPGDPDDFDDPGYLGDFDPDDDIPPDPTTEYAVEDYYMADPFLEMMQIDLYQEDGIGSKIKDAIQALIAKIKSMIKTFKAKRTVAQIDKMKNIINDTKKAEKAKKKMSKKSWNHDMIMAILARCDVIVNSWAKAMSNNPPATAVDQIYDESIKGLEQIEGIRYEYSDEPISLYQFCRWCVEEYNSLGVLMTRLDDMEFGIRDEDYYAYEDEEILKKAVVLFKTIIIFVDVLMAGNQKIINSVNSQLALDPGAFRKLVSDAEPPEDDPHDPTTTEYVVDENNNDIYNEGVDTMSNYESYENDDITIDDVDSYIESMTDNLNNAKALRDQMVQEEAEYEDYKCEFVNTNDFVFESDTEELLTDAEFFDESYEPDSSPLIDASDNCIQFQQEFTLAEAGAIGGIIGGCIAMIKPFLDLKKFGRFPKDLMRVFEIVKSENFEASENKKALKKALKAVSKDLNYLTGPAMGTGTWTVNERKELNELRRITNNIMHGGVYGTSMLRKSKKQSDVWRVPARLKEFVEQSEKVLKLLKKRDEELDAAGVSKKMQLRTGAANAITEWMV